MARSRRRDNDGDDRDDYAAEYEFEYEPHQGTLVLVFGILGLCCCMPIGIAAWVMGNNQISGMDEGRIDPAGRGTAQAGKILGMISVGLSVVIALFYGVVIAFAVQNGGFNPNNPNPFGPNNGFNQNNGFNPNNGFNQNNKDEAPKVEQKAAIPLPKN